MQSFRFTLLLFGLCLASCSRAPAPATIDKEKSINGLAENVIPPGDLMQDSISFEFAIYYLPRPLADPLAKLDILLAAEDGFFERVDKVQGIEKRPTVAARIEADPKKSYAPPDLRSLQYFGRGLSREQAEALETTESALILDFQYPRKNFLDGMRAAVRLAHSLASASGGLLWDDETREVFSLASWEERRIADWTEEFPDVSKHTVIHAYQKDEYVRAITLGMAKFGLPDLVIENFSWSSNRNMGHIVNLFAQALVEGGVVRERAEFDLDIRAIKNSQVRDPQLATLKENATGVALLSLKKGIWEEGDPKNRILEIAFDRSVGPDEHAKQEYVVSQAFGWKDAVTRIKHDDELRSASREARTKLPGLCAEFQLGLAPGEFIQLKLPFERPDGGDEWMWVEVISWDGDRISGLLNNEPFEIPTLHAGQTVEVSEAKVFDYIRKHADGTIEGNETGKIIEKQAEQ